MQRPGLFVYIKVIWVQEIKNINSNYTFELLKSILLKLVDKKLYFASTKFVYNMSLKFII